MPDEKSRCLMTSIPHSNGSNAEVAVHEEGPGTAVVEFRGELTRHARLDRLRSAVQELCLNELVSRVRVDLRRATAIDLQGLGALLGLRRECEEHGATFVVDNPQGSVRSRLEQTGTLDYLRGAGGAALG
jgi:anti-anti-sigma factor